MNSPPPEEQGAGIRDVFPPASMLELEAALTPVFSLYLEGETRGSAAEQCSFSGGAANHRWSSAGTASKWGAGAIQILQVENDFLLV